MECLEPLDVVVDLEVLALTLDERAPLRDRGRGAVRGVEPTMGMHTAVIARRASEQGVAVDGSPEAAT